MMIKGYLSAVTVAAALAGTPAAALTLAQASQPRETPPASYQSDVYVDSRGCAYARVTLGNSVNWVPRLKGSDRKEVVCGLTPTFAAGQPRPSAPPEPIAPPPPVEPQVASAPVVTNPKPVVRTTATATATVAAPTTVTAPAPAPVPVASLPKPSPAPAPSDHSASRETATEAPATSATMRIASLPKPSPAPAPTVYTTETAAPVGAPAPAPSRTMKVTCPAGRSTARVIVGGDTVAVDCGAGLTQPQTTTVQHADGATTTLVVHPAPTVTKVAARTSGAPFSNPSMAPIPKIPEGYRAAWDDDRLNPNRGPRTLEGEAQMATVWTNTLPRKLVKVPVTSSQTTRVVTVSKSAPQPVAATGHRYVQVGSFREPANAQATANRLNALGLPGRVAQTQSGMTVVLAGPFSDQSTLQSALAKARQSGYSDAFLR